MLDGLYQSGLRVLYGVGARICLDSGEDFDSASRYIEMT